MGHNKLSMILSVVLTIASLVLLATRGLNFGLDFTGGTLVEVQFQKNIDLQDVRHAMAQQNFKDVVAQNFGARGDVLLRMKPSSNNNAEQIGDKVMGILQTLDKNVQMKRIEFVGPSVGSDLAEQGGLAILAALGCILIYVAFRFEWRFAVGAVLALAHDTILTLGLFSMMRVQFDLTVVAGLLTLIGYSLNDTIVVCDRIRENFRKIRKGAPRDIINASITQVFSRTIITSATTAMVLAVLFFLGGNLIHSFATAMLFGIIVGTHSSIYVASSLALWLGVKKEDFMPKVIEKEGADQKPLL
ncbi:protein translocase subunit SecF [Celerinatantimonas yamalensis]|uniref:Protein-export membrane protein SecF n=2 Tax=Celerinatantimonas yamalensis TaxID=559956 RepID=A0ABW9G6K6_9GAMM